MRSFAPHAPRRALRTAATVLLISHLSARLSPGTQVQPPQTNLAAIVRHAPILNGNGRIEGSVQQILGEPVTVGGGFVLTGDLLVPGAPRLRLSSFCAAIICSTSSISFCASTSGERVGFQSR